MSSAGLLTWRVTLRWLICSSVMGESSAPLQRLLANGSASSALQCCEPLEELPAAFDDLEAELWPVVLGSDRVAWCPATLSSRTGATLTRAFLLLGDFLAFATVLRAAAESPPASADLSSCKSLLSLSVLASSGVPTGWEDPSTAATSCAFLVTLLLPTLLLFAGFVGVSGAWLWVCPSSSGAAPLLLLFGVRFLGSCDAPA